MANIVNHTDLILLLLTMAANSFLLSGIIFLIKAIKEKFNINKEKDAIVSFLIAMLLSINYAVVSAFYIHSGEFDLISKITRMGFIFFSFIACMLVVFTPIYYVALTQIEIYGAKKDD